MFIIIVPLSAYSSSKNEADKVSRTGPIFLAPLRWSSISAVTKACTFVAKIPFLHTVITFITCFVTASGKIFRHKSLECVIVYPIFSTMNLVTSEKVQSRSNQGSNFLHSHNSLQFPRKEEQMDR